MRILDIDLDFFLNKIMYFPKKKRPNEQEYIPWDKDQFIEFLENNCNLSKNNKTPGRIVKKHHKAFYFWRELIEKNKLEVPFEVIHIDAHADLGLGDDAYVYIMEELLKNPVEKRTDPEKIYEGNYLVFAIANRWIKNITYVHHPEAQEDRMQVHFKGYDVNSGYIQLKQVKKILPFDILASEILCLEPEVPFNLISGKDYLEEGNFDYVVFSISPKYTPKTTDKLLLPIVKEYIEEI
uniref:Uncharacterized protein n=1 Tax=Methanococcus maripaludis (strain C6 / ATCC BAA-1332) TaxID=444158 RepID=A9AA45_METM6